MIYYGTNLKQVRESRNLTQKELSKLTGISQQNISRWEKNQILPNIDFIVQLANFYEISIDELIGRDNVNIRTYIRK